MECRDPSIKSREAIKFLDWIEKFMMEQPPCDSRANREVGSSARADHSNSLIISPQNVHCSGVEDCLFHTASKAGVSAGQPHLQTPSASLDTILWYLFYQDYHTDLPFSLNLPFHILVISKGSMTNVFPA